MEASELLSIVAAGESSKVQFKREIAHNDALAAEMVAMANTKGGIILIGVEDKTGKLSGIKPSPELNERIANIASNHVSPPIFVTTEIISIAIREDKKYILSIHVSEGINKPYKDKSGTIWVKQGADKRKLLDNAEILKLFQSGRNLSADEMEIFGTSIEDVDEKQFSKYFVQEFGRSFQDYGFNLAQALKAKRILLSDQLTLAGLLFFSKAPQQFKPAFTIKVVSFFGNDIGSNSYRSKPKDLEGTIPELFNKAIDFIMSNIHHLQSGDSFNSPGKPEISRLALEEVIQNALIHRDYLKNAPVRILIFDNRLEIISPGKLPNGLTVEDIKFGNPYIRNNLLVAFSIRTMPFSGLGSGIRRALNEQPDIEFVNYVNGDQFKVIIPRPHV